MLLLFAVTWIPSGLFHVHEEDVHHLAMLSHAEDHHCELDFNFCQGEAGSNCEHQQHLAKKHASCFSCQFQFSGYYMLSIQYPELFRLSFATYVLPAWQQEDDYYTYAPSGRAPPAFS